MCHVCITVVYSFSTYNIIRNYSSSLYLVLIIELLNPLDHVDRYSTFSSFDMSSTSLANAIDIFQVYMQKLFEMSLNMLSMLQSSLSW